MTKQDRRWWFNSHVTAGSPIALGSVAAAVSGSLWLDISAVGASPHRGRRPVATRARSASGGDRQRRPNYESYEHSNPRVTDNRPVPVRHLAAPLPDRPQAGARQGRDRPRLPARRIRLRRRLRRPEPHDPPLQSPLRPDAWPLPRLGARQGARKTVSRCAPSRRGTVSQGDARPGLR
jgi:hypothetical protein